jgi:hypothetical protein
VATGLNTSESLRMTTQALLTLIQNFDLLLGSDVNYLFGRFQSAAQNMATTGDEVLWAGLCGLVRFRSSPHPVKCIVCWKPGCAVRV